MVGEIKKVKELLERKLTRESIVIRHSLSFLVANSTIKLPNYAHTLFRRYVALKESSIGNQIRFWS